jgi:hypothetical protein
MMNGNPGYYSNKKQLSSFNMQPPQNFSDLRSEAVKRRKQLDKMDERFQEYVQQVTSQLKAQYDTKVADLEDSYQELEDQIEQINRRALRRLKQQEVQIMANKNMDKNEKIEAIKQLREDYERNFHPSDEYEQYLKEHSIESLIQNLFGSFGFPSMSLMLGEGGGERGASRKMLQGPSSVSYQVLRNGIPINQGSYTIFSYYNNQSYEVPRDTTKIEEIVD